MNTNSGATRWWEYYLPRYLMPSVAGVVIVSWLCSYGGDGFRSILSLPSGGTRADSSSLILLLLYGNLFCYLASYPVLVFHATRVMDFSNNGRWPAHPVFDGYILATVLTVGVFLFHFVSPEYRYWPAFITASLVAVVQLVRLGIVFFPRYTAPGHVDPFNAPYFYAYVLAHRRVATEEGPESEPLEWRDEFVETYRHLREHGNSALIFLLELVLAALAYCVISKPGQSPTHQLGGVGLLFAIWAFPSAFVHLVAQHLERRFSRYDLGIRAATELRH